MTFSAHIVRATSAITANYGDLILADTTVAAFAVTLPIPSIGLRGIDVIKTPDIPNSVTITPSAGILINGSATYVLSNSYQAVHLEPTGTNWVVTSTVAGTTPTPIFSPASLGSKLKIWLEADDVAVGAVSAWNSISPATFNATQATSANQPTGVANQINGHKVVRFDGTDDFMSFGTSTIISETPGSQYTVFYVALIPNRGGGVDNWVIARDSDTQGRDFGIGKEAGAQGWTIAGGPRVINIAGTQPDVFQCATIDSIAGGTRKAYLNGVLDTTITDAQVGGTATGPTLMGRRSYVGAEGYGIIDLAALYVCTPRCTSGELADMHTYILARFGL